MERLRPWLPMLVLAVAAVFSYWGVGVLLVRLHDLMGKDVFGLDLALMNAVWAWTPRSCGPFLQFLSWLLAAERWPLLVAVVAPLCIWLWRSDRRFEAAGLATAVTLALLGVGLAKVMFKRDRPDVPWAIAHEVSYSFPSGHSAMAVVLYGMAAYLLGRVTRKWWLGLPAAALALALAAATAYSRIYLGAHYPLDVLGGALSGALWLVTGIATTELLYFTARPNLEEELRRAAAAGRERARAAARLAAERWRAYRRKRGAA